MKVTLILNSKKLNASKYGELNELSHRLGKIRSEVWQDYSSLRGVGLYSNHPGLRENDCLQSSPEYLLPVRKALLRKIEPTSGCLQYNH